MGDAPEKIMVNGTVEVIWDGRITSCKKCGASIGFGVTKNNKRMPFDVNDPRHTSHFASCPNASEFKRKE